MRIGFVSIIQEPWGGSEELWAAAAHDLLDTGHEVIITTLNTGIISPKLKLLTAKKAHLIFRRGYIQPGLSFKKRVPKKISNFLVNKIDNPYKKFFSAKPDVLVYTGACDSLANDPYFLQLAYQKQIPLVIINQVSYEYVRVFFEHDAQVLRKAFQYAEANLFVARRNKEVMERFLASEIPNSKVVRNPVNLSSIEPVPFPDTDQAQMAIVANLLINHKGHDLIFDVLRQNHWSKRKWSLNIYGAGIDEQYLKKLSAFYGLQDRIQFHGKVSDIRDVWAKNQILLMPSRLEGTPLALVEAMLCGRTAVVTDVGGHAEWIDDNVLGFLAEGANVRSLDQAMERAWNEKENWEIIGQKARKRALDLYDPTPGKTLANIISQCHK